MSGYVGRGINYGNAVADHFTGNGGATYTLTYDTTTNGVVVTLDGVVQKNGSDFNVTGTSLVFTSTVASPIAIQVIYTGLTLSIGIPADGTIGTSKISDNAVTGAKIAMGSDAQGDVLYYNGTDYVRLPKGTASQVLKMNSGATAPEWAADADTTNTNASNLVSGTLPDGRFPSTLPASSGENLTALPAGNLTGTVADARLSTVSSSKLSGALPAISGASLTGLNASNLGSGTVPTARLGSGTASSSTFLRGDSTYAEAGGGGAWNLIGTSEASNSSSLTITGLDSTYDVYALGLSDIRPQNNGGDCQIRVGDSSGIDSGSSDYGYVVQAATSGGAGIYGNSSGNSKIIFGDIGNSGVTGAGMGALFYLTRPADGLSYPVIHGTMWYCRDSGWSNQSQGFRCGWLHGHRNAVITLDRVEITFHNGNVGSGRFSIWGIAHA